MAADRDIGSIPERECEVLRLLVRGHDAKSVACALGLSVHVVNERLRDARRRLGVSSSREAARLLAAHEGDKFPGNTEIGLGAAAPRGADGRRFAGRAGAASRLAKRAPGGIVMIVILAAALGALALNHRAAQVPNAPPHVVATSPAAGATIPPGPLLLTVTYDQPMLDGSYSYTRSSPDTYPDCAARPDLSRDGRTFTLRCAVAAGRQYEIWFNRPPYMNFRGLNAVSAEPHQLLFRTRAR